MQAIGFLPQLADPFSHRYVLNVQLQIPRSPRDGNSAIAAKGSHPHCSTACKEIQMAFVNEVVSDDDIAKYRLPFAPNTKCYWTRDIERDSYLWGSILGDNARGYESEGRFDFFMRNSLFSIALKCGDSSVSFKDSPYRVTWDSIMRVQPSDFAGFDVHEVIATLKEALICFGYDGRKNQFAPSRLVLFNF